MEKQLMYNALNENFFEIKNNFEIYQDVKSHLLYGQRKKCQISIMIPTYLRNKYLKETLISALNQNTNIPYEIVVVDNNDNFDDNETLEMIKNFNSDNIAYYKNEKNLGMFGNWNRCIELANGEWILILHDDDTIEKNYIQEMVKYINATPNVAAIECTYNSINEKSEQIIEQKSWKNKYVNRIFKNYLLKINARDFYYSHPIGIMGLFFNKQKAIEIGGFNDKWFPTSDYIFILNLAYRYDVLLLNHPLLNYRIAVNASLTIKHLIGIFEMDAYMVRSIYQTIFNGKKSKKLSKIQECFVLEREKSLKPLTFKLSEEEINYFNEEIKNFNKYMGYGEYTAKKERYFSSKYKKHKLYMLLFHRVKVGKKK